MCNAISLLTVGRVTDRFGKRNIILGAGVLVIVGAAVASQAQNMNTLIGANVCIGLPLFPLGRFGRKQSKVNKVLIGMASGAHSAVGLFIGGRYLPVSSLTRYTTFDSADNFRIVSTSIQVCDSGFRFDTYGLFPWVGCIHRSSIGRNTKLAMDILYSHHYHRCSSSVLFGIEH